MAVGQKNIKKIICIKAVLGDLRENGNGNSMQFHMKCMNRAKSMLKYHNIKLFDNLNVSISKTIKEKQVKLMDKFQRGILLIASAAFTIYLFFSLVDVKKSSKWLKWYWQMNLEERRKYDPRIAIGRIKKILVMIFIIGIFGFLLSWFVKPVISIITFSIILVILVFSIGYTRPKNCLLEEKE